MKNQKEINGGGGGDGKLGWDLPPLSGKTGCGGRRILVFITYTADRAYKGKRGRSPKVTESVYLDL